MSTLKVAIEIPRVEAGQLALLRDWVALAERLGVALFVASNPILAGSSIGRLAFRDVRRRKKVGINVGVSNEWQDRSFKNRYLS